MANKNLALILMAVTALGLAACKEETKTETTEQSNVGGTEIERTTTTETKTDDDGNMERETKTETTVDPQGLMNKETEETKSTEEHTTE